MKTKIVRTLFIWLVSGVLGVMLILSIIHFFFNDMIVAKRRLKYFDYRGARTHLERVLTKDSQNTEAQFYLAIVSAKLGDVKEAVRMLDQVRAEPEGFSTTATMHNEAGMVYYLNEQYPKAIEEFRTARELNKRFVDAQFNLGMAYSAHGDSHRAIQAYHEVLKINPKHPNTHWNLAVHLEKEGKFAEAITHWEKYKEATLGMFQHPKVDQRIAELKKMIEEENQ